MKKFIVSIATAVVSVSCLMFATSASARTEIIAQFYDGHRHHHNHYRPYYPRHHWARRDHGYYPRHYHPHPHYYR